MNFLKIIKLFNFHMKRIKFFTVIIAALTGVAACTELLEQMPNNSISGASMWTTEDHADQGVAGVYQALYSPVNINDRGAEMPVIELIGMTSYNRYAAPMFNAGTGASPDQTAYIYFWLWAYTGIHRANDALAHLPDIPMNESKKARLIAECKILRAYFYMRLNELFGNGGLGVPVYLEPVSPEECVNGQTPEAEVWALIVQDLTEAINEPALPDHNIGGNGHASRGAAYAFRGRAHLLTKDYDKAIADFVKVGECGYGLYEGNYKELFKVAQERCKEMIFSLQYDDKDGSYGVVKGLYYGIACMGAQGDTWYWGDYSVANAFVDLYEVVVDAGTVKPFNWNDIIPEWDGMDVAGREVFFIRDRDLNGTEILPASTTKINERLNELGTAATLYLPEGNEARIKKAYANRDPRLAYCVLTPYADLLGVDSPQTTAEMWYTYRWPLYFEQHGNSAVAEPNANPNLPDTYYPSGFYWDQNFTYRHLKFIGEGLESRGWSCPIDEPVIRYADILLMWAEALVEKNDLNGAMDKVKKVRDRAGIPTMTSSFSDQTTARNYVRDERRRELVNEGHNFFDEMRWRTLKETKIGQEFQKYPWGTPKPGAQYYAWRGDFLYTWPVPRAELEMNPNLKPTPGWVY